MRAMLKQADNEIRTLGLLHPPEFDGAQIADALRSFVARFVRRTGIQANARR
jgi:signal transduction histidine kinase